MAKFKVIRKIIKTPCYCCTESLYGQARPPKNCPACRDTGKYPETFYYHIYMGKDGKKYCIDGDTVK